MQLEKPRICVAVKEEENFSFLMCVGVQYIYVGINVHAISGWPKQQEILRLDRYRIYPTHILTHTYLTNIILAAHTNIHKLPRLPPAHI